MAPEERRILVYDTTLRDGEQSPGMSMNPAEKLRMAAQLERLGIDIIEAGFPVASEGDFEAVRRIAREIRSVQIAAIARAKKGDIDRAWDALKDAANPRIHIFISSSDIHLKHQIKKTRQEVLADAYQAVQYACSYTDNVEFTAMDATRTDRDFLCEVLEIALASGAKTINIADTVGCALPGPFGGLVGYLLNHVRSTQGVLLSVHCHDDLGLAVANTLAAVERGAGQVKCTINGIGERAGNAALEEVVMALDTRKDFFRCRTGVTKRHIYETSRLLTEITGTAVQPNKAIVGANAFAHESGIHQDGLIKEKSTYEIIDPISVGVPKRRLVLGKHSGRNAIGERLMELGYELTSDEIGKMTVMVKQLGDSGRQLEDNDLETLLHEEIFCMEETHTLAGIESYYADVSGCTMKVGLDVHGRAHEVEGSGMGPVEALMAAMGSIAGAEYILLEYSGKTITNNGSFQSEAVLRLMHGECSVKVRGVHEDIAIASVNAYIKALNLLEWKKTYMMRKSHEIREVSACG